MATILQGNGMKPLQNGSYSALEMNKLSGGVTHEMPASNETLCQMKSEQVCTDNFQEDYQNNAVLPMVISDEPEVDIVINNVVCSFSVRCHLNLRQIALNGCHVEYRRENGMLTMKLRKPYTTASMWSSGKVTCTGATSEEMSHVAARRFARRLQHLGFKTRFTNYRVVNVLGTCSMPFAIKITLFSEKHREAEYEPELHPGVTYKLKNPKATLKIFSTGSITVTAPSVLDVQRAIETIYPLVYEFRKEKIKSEDASHLKEISRKRKHSTCDEEQSDDDSSGY